MIFLTFPSLSYILYETTGGVFSVYPVGVLLVSMSFTIVPCLGISTIPSLLSSNIDRLHFELVLVMHASDWWTCRTPYTKIPHSGAA